jgi:hypothetical protein
LLWHGTYARLRLRRAAWSSTLIFTIFVRVTSFIFWFMMILFLLFGLWFLFVFPLLLWTFWTLFRKRSLLKLFQFTFS